MIELFQFWVMNFSSRKLEILQFCYNNCFFCHRLHFSNHKIILFQPIPQIKSYFNKHLVNAFILCEYWPLIEVELTFFLSCMKFNKNQIKWWQTVKVLFLKTVHYYLFACLYAMLYISFHTTNDDCFLIVEEKKRY